MNAEKVIAALLDSDTDAATVISQLDEAAFDTQDELQKRNEAKQRLADAGYAIFWEQTDPAEGKVHWHVRAADYNPVSEDFYEPELRRILNPYSHTNSIHCEPGWIKYGKNYPVEGEPGTFNVGFYQHRPSYWGPPYRESNWKRLRHKFQKPRDWEADSEAFLRHLKRYDKDDPNKDDPDMS